MEYEPLTVFVAVEMKVEIPLEDGAQARIFMFDKPAERMVGQCDFQIDRFPVSQKFSRLPVAAEPKPSFLFILAAGPCSIKSG